MVYLPWCLLGPSTGWVVPPCHQNSANKDLSQAQLQRVNMTGHEWFGNGAWLFACKVLQKWLKLLWKLKLKSLSFQIKWIPGGTAFKCYPSTSIALYGKAGFDENLKLLAWCDGWKKCFLILGVQTVQSQANIRTLQPLGFPVSPRVSHMVPSTKST